MKTLSLTLNFHIPLKINSYHFFKIGTDHSYYDESDQKEQVEAICKNRYEPILKSILSLCGEYPSAFNFSIHVSGTTIKLLQRYHPQTLLLLQDTAVHNGCEVVCGTYSNSLSSLFDINKFEKQVMRHKLLMRDIFGKKIVSFVNCHLVFSDTIAESINNMGFKTALVDLSPIETTLKSVNSLYGSVVASGLTLISCNKEFSRIFNNISKKDNAGKFIKEIDSPSQKGGVVTIMADCNLFDINFFTTFVNSVIAIPQLEFLTPSECVQEYQRVCNISVCDKQVKEDYFKRYGKISPLVIDALSTSFCCEQKNELIDEYLDKLDFLHSSDHIRDISSDDDYFCTYINYMNAIQDFQSAKGGAFAKY